MRKIARIQCVGLLLAVLWCVVVAATADIDPIETVTLPDSTFNAIAKLPSGGYLLGGAVPTGSQPWETRPGITVYGSTNDAPTYNIDGIDIAQGAAVSFDQVEEMELMTGGFRAEYGGPGFSAAVLDYEAGGTAVVQVVTKSGTNKFVGLRFTYVNESLNSLTYGEDGSLWGAGTVFAPDPVPVLGFFDESGGFTQVENPLTALGGFLNGIEFMGIGVGYGYTMPDGAPTRPLLTYSYDYGVTWEAPPNLPWVFGTINTLQPVDTYLWWLGGETPSGAGFAHTADGGATWMSQMMPDATYIWDLEIAMLPIEPSSCDETKILGAALGTYYVDEYTKESIVYRTLDGKTWEEMWRVPGYGGDLFFDYLGDGEIGIVQNGLDGTATFSRYAAHDFFGGTNIICDMEIIQGADTTYPDEPLTLQLDLRGPWGEPIVVDTVEWSTDWGELVVDPNDPLVATFTAAAPGEAKVMCTEPASGWSTSAVISVQLSIE
jgi:hypothetical protein